MAAVLALLAGCSEKHMILAEKKAVENGLLPAIQVKGTPSVKFNIHERMEYYNVPGLSIAVVKEGRIRWADGYGIANTETGKMVDENTLFQAASISKPVAALGVLMLAEEGLIDIHSDANNYLKDWKIPGNEHTIEERVTPARLLSHTAGMTVHGFPGYPQNDDFPILTDVLNGNGNTPPVFVDTIPGSIWRYSGGGYTVMEKVVEDITGVPFEEFMGERVLTPLGMSNSTYEQPLPGHFHDVASAAYNRQGKIIEGLWHNYPEKAAAGLWTTPSDLARYCIEIQDIVSGKSAGIISNESVVKMLTRLQNDWGLGPSLRWGADSLIFEHGGKNAGFTNTLVSFANRGDAVIIMANGDGARELINEILRSVSYYYQWGISYPEIAEPVEMPGEVDLLTGEYAYRIDDKDFVLKINTENGELYASKNEIKTTLVHVGELQFISEDGDRYIFSKEREPGIYSLILNRTFRLLKAKRE